MEGSSTAKQGKGGAETILRENSCETAILKSFLSGEKGGEEDQGEEGWQSNEGRKQGRMVDEYHCP